jgi:hypothetical protein
MDETATTSPLFQLMLPGSTLSGIGPVRLSVTRRLSARSRPSRPRFVRKSTRSRSSERSFQLVTSHHHELRRLAERQYRFAVPRASVGGDRAEPLETERRGARQSWRASASETVSRRKRDDEPGRAKTRRIERMLRRVEVSSEEIEASGRCTMRTVAETRRLHPRSRDGNRPAAGAETSP